jgi:hypothetical protein
MTEHRNTHTMVMSKLAPPRTPLSEASQEVRDALNVPDDLDGDDRHDRHQRSMWVIGLVCALVFAAFIGGRHVQASADAPHMVTDAQLQQLATTKGCTFVRVDGHLSFVCRNSGVR